MAIAEAERATSVESPLRLHAVLWNALSSASVAYALTELLDNLPDNAVERNLWCLRGDPSSPRAYHRPGLPPLLFRALCKARVPMEKQGRIASKVALRSIEAGDVVYVWPPYDVRLIRRAQERGALVVAERTNCMGDMCRDVLTSAYGRRGLPLPDDWYVPEKVAEERAQMLRCDFVTAPNALVAQSLRDAGLPDKRILETSYGFNRERLASAIGINRPPRPAVFAFVGTGIVRKGLDVLLEAWERASPNGTLLIAGRIDDEIRETYARALSRSDLRELGFVEDVASVYAAADVFVFPTHEEGGPQVTYEAAACGLASIVSPMGAGRIVRDELEGIIIDPLDVDAVAGALTRLADDSSLRRTFGGNAAERAREFEWSQVGLRLHDLFCSVAERRFR